MKPFNRPLSYYQSNNLFYGLLLWGCVMTFLTIYISQHRACPYVWHGGSPTFKGNCWCGENDGYCLCTPSLAIDAIIEVRKSIHTNPEDFDSNEVQIILVKRRDPPRDVYALPGGFVDVGETVEEAVIREAKEETNLALSIEHNYLEQFRVYSDPNRDKRRHTVSAVCRCIVSATDTVSLKKGDDAKQVVQMPLKDALKLNLGFDHHIILTDYIKKFHPSLLAKQ